MVEAAESPQFISPVRAVGLDAPSKKKLPCACVLASEPFDRAAQTVRLVVDHADCTEGHAPLPPGAQTAYCSCLVRALPADGTRQVFDIDFARCTARSVPVPPTTTPRP